MPRHVLARDTHLVAPSQFRLIHCPVSLVNQEFALRAMKAICGNPPLESVKYFVYLAQKSLMWKPLSKSYSEPV